MSIHDIIVRPIITEKSIADAGKGKFTFEVLLQANKDAIALAIEKLFQVNVVAVATSILKGKSKRVGARRAEKALRSWKKATVKLKEGQKIALFELGEQK